MHETLFAGAIQPFGQDEALAEETPQRLRPALRAQLGDHVGRVVRKDDPPDGAAPSRLRRAFGRIQVIHGLPIFPQVRGKLVELGIVAGQESNRAGGTCSVRSSRSANSSEK